MTIRQRIYLDGLLKADTGIRVVPNARSGTHDSSHQVIASGPESGGWEVLARKVTAEAVAEAASKYFEAFRSGRSAGFEWNALHQIVSAHEAGQ